jgi:hypothetical protein
MATGRAARGSGAYSTGDAAYLLGLSPGYAGLKRRRASA